MKENINTLVNDELFLYKHKDEIMKLVGKYFKSKKYFNPFDLMQYDCQYLMAYGEKSNGKTTGWQIIMCAIYVLFGARSYYLRFYEHDFAQNNAKAIFGGLPVDLISDITNKKYDCVVEFQHAFYFAKYDAKTGKYIKDKTPFCYRRSIYTMGSSFKNPDVKLIMYDEFIRSDGIQITSEVLKVMTAFSTLKRESIEIQIVMCANTWDRNSKYFKEMGLKHVRFQEQGTIDVYNLAKIQDAMLKIACYYCDSPANKDKKSDIYFAFNNPKLRTITSGDWCSDYYPKYTRFIKPKDVELKYFILNDDLLFTCKVVLNDLGETFTYISLYNEKVEEPLNPEEDIVYSFDKDNALPNWFKNVLLIVYPFQKTIVSYYRENKIFYESNVVGDCIKEYLSRC